MSNTPDAGLAPAQTCRIKTSDLPLHCPTDHSQLWNAHPRVFLPIEKTGEALCPYCGTRYLLEEGE